MHVCNAVPGQEIVFPVRGEIVIRDAEISVCPNPNSEFSLYLVKADSHRLVIIKKTKNSILVEGEDEYLVGVKNNEQVSLVFKKDNHAIVVTLYDVEKGNIVSIL